MTVNSLTNRSKLSMIKRLNLRITSSRLYNSDNKLNSLGLCLMLPLSSGTTTYPSSKSLTFMCTCTPAARRLWPSVLKRWMAHSWAVTSLHLSLTKLTMSLKRKCRLLLIYLCFSPDFMNTRATPKKLLEFATYYLLSNCLRILERHSTASELGSPNKWARWVSRYPNKQPHLLKAQRVLQQLRSKKLKDPAK